MLTYRSVAWTGVDERFAHWVRQRDDESLERLMRGPLRRPLLRLVFRRARRRVEAATAADERALIEIRIREEDGPGDRWHLLLGRGRLTATTRDLGEPDSTVVIDPVDFLRLIAGQTTSRELFVARQISVDGSLFLAAELPGLFSVSKAPQDPG